MRPIVKIKDQATQDDTVRLMLEHAREATRDPMIRKYAEAIGKHPDRLKRLLAFVWNNTYFYPDDRFKQIVKSPSATLNTGFANCVNYSVLISAFLRLWKIPHHFKKSWITDSSGNRQTHIYVVTDSGIVIDPVVNQDQTGSELLVRDDKQPAFNAELPYSNSELIKAYPMELYSMNGISVSPQAMQGYADDIAIIERAFAEARAAGVPEAMQGQVINALPLWAASVLKGKIRVGAGVKKALERFRANKALRDQFRRLKKLNAEAVKSGLPAPFTGQTQQAQAAEGQAGLFDSKKKRQQQYIMAAGGVVALIAILAATGAFKKKRR